MSSQTLGLSVEVNAPRILIAEDVMEANSPLLVIDLGSLSIYNDDVRAEAMKSPTEVSYYFCVNKVYDFNENR